MEKDKATLDVSSDVLHIPAQTGLSPEEIARAVAHHNRHHQHDQRAEPPKSAPKAGPRGKIK